MRKFIVSLFLICWGVLGSAQAQFIGFSVDTAVDYTAAPDKVFGGTVGIVHPVPFFPNIGFTQVSFDDEKLTVDTTNNTELTTSITIQSAHLFWNVPFPVVAVSLGGGAGQLVAESELSTGGDKAENITPVIEGFFRLGLPFWNFLEFHIGYHALKTSQKVDRARSSDTTLSTPTYTKNTRVDYTGALTTVGLQFAF
jgi:hypothetical protein